MENGQHCPEELIHWSFDAFNDWTDLVNGLYTTREQRETLEERIFEIAGVYKMCALYDEDGNYWGEGESLIDINEDSSDYTAEADFGEILGPPNKSDGTAAADYSEVLGPMTNNANVDALRDGN